jgi:hypothetical protein
MWLPGLFAAFTTAACPLAQAPYVLLYCDDGQKAFVLVRTAVGLDGVTTIRMFDFRKLRFLFNEVAGDFEAESFADPVIQLTQISQQSLFLEFDRTAGKGPSAAGHGKCGAGVGAHRGALDRRVPQPPALARPEPHRRPCAKPDPPPDGRGAQLFPFDGSRILQPRACYLTRVLLNGRLVQRLCSGYLSDRHAPTADAATRRRC